MDAKRSTIVAVVIAITAMGMVPLTRHFLSSLEPGPKRVDFNQDIRPILNQHCTSCHGGVKQVDGVSFIYREEALRKGKSGRPIIVPSHPERSELIARVKTSDPQARMPYDAPPLSADQIALLREWIKEGAHWAEHWAFIAPKRKVLPSVRRTEWPHRPIDRFILARLEQEGLQPSPEASKAALLRRASLDLTGLPPTPEELSTFLEDTSPNSYEKQVDRLLASPHFGERWATLWLDLARYADSRGYEKDLSRPTWPYRDWVVEAFNANMRYDRFVITQLAGDLLPNPTFRDLVATSFHRQTPVNDEGGTDDEEYRLAAVMDRVSTTWSVLNGITFGCAQCHSHPYDPIRHEEYYKFLAFFNTSQDADRLDDWPTLAVAKDQAHQRELTQLTLQSATLLKEIVEQGRVRADQSRWTSLPIASAAVNIALRRDRQNESMTALEIRKGEAYAIGTIPAQSAFELLTESVPTDIAALKIEAPPIDPARALRNPEDGFIVSQIEAWIVSPGGQQRKVSFRYFVPDSEEDLAGMLKARAGVGKAFQSSVYFSANPKLYKTRWLVGILEERLSLKSGSRLKVQLTHTQTISEREAVIRRVRLFASDDKRWSEFGSDKALIAKTNLFVDLDRRLVQVPSVSLPIMLEQPSYARRESFKFERGNVAAKVGPSLAPDVPALFPKLPEGQPRNRLTMARWFFAPGQPLTARVAVNRFWEQLFGTGLVETLEDFGSVGEAPSHPELLDWLALHFETDLRWDVKALLRELATSATYRQSAAVTPELLKRDPRNRLLARGPQQRLTAEMVRDQAMLASGLLTPTLGGPPVMPPLPAGAWVTVYNAEEWTNATGPDRYRRAIYTFLKRSAMYPSLVTFDAADHVVSLARRIPTNTPLQALVTLNDPVYYEATEALAKRMKAIDGLSARFDVAARRVLSRSLAPEELAVLEDLYNHAYRSAAESNRNEAQVSVTAADKDLHALTAVASALFNLDAALTR